MKFGEKMKFKTQVKTQVLSSFLIKVLCNRMICNANMLS